MTKTSSKFVNYNGELRNWRISRDTKGEVIYAAGDMYNDLSGVFHDGERYEVHFFNIKSFSDMGLHYLLRTTGWTLKLMKNEELP